MACTRPDQRFRATLRILTPRAAPHSEREEFRRLSVARSATIGEAGPGARGERAPLSREENGVRVRTRFHDGERPGFGSFELTASTSARRAQSGCGVPSLRLQLLPEVLIELGLGHAVLFAMGFRWTS